MLIIHSLFILFCIILFFYLLLKPHEELKSLCLNIGSSKTTSTVQSFLNIPYNFLIKFMKKEREKGEYRYIEHLFVMYSVILPPICILFLPSEHILNPSNISDTRWIFSAAYIIWLIANVGFDSLSFYCTRRFFSVVINDEQLTFVKLIKYGFCDFIISGFCLLMTILATNLAYALELGNQDLNTLLSLTVDVAGTISKPFALNWGGNVIHLGVATLKQCKMH